MSNLKRALRTLNRQATFFSATVLATSGTRATVRLSTGGVIYRSLQVYGGPVSVGQVVKVDMTTDVPYIIAPSTPAQQTAGALKIKDPRKATGIPQSSLVIVEGQILRYTNNILVESYPFSNTGLNDCLSDCLAGDRVVIPNGVLTINFTIPTYVKVSGAGVGSTTIFGQVELTENCTLETISVINEITSGSSVTAIYAGINVDATLLSMKALAFNCGSGNAYGLFAESYQTHIVCNNTTLIGESRLGAGYGAYQA
jgi:hypothetical protein